MPWSPEQYLKFEKERFLPFEDAIALVRVRPKLRVIDLGCGTGQLTRRLADALPESDVIGVDASAEMLAKANAHARDGLRFEAGTIEELIGGEARFDLVFSHAAIQWVDDHVALVPGLFSRVADGGQLVVQLPSNHTHPTHTTIRALASEEPFRTALGGWSRTPPVLSIERYAELLHRASARDIIVFEKVFPHVLDDADALGEWTRGTALLPYLDRLPPEMHKEFMNEYRASLRATFAESPVFYPFRRIFFSASRAPAESLHLRA